MMNAAADWLGLAALVALAYAVMVFLLRLPVAPVREIVLTSAPRQVTATQIEFAARAALAGNFFTLDTHAVRAAFEKLPWVREADVRRRWPDTLAVSLREHEAFAQWNPGQAEPRLVDHRGEVFSGASTEELPALAGPEGSAAVVLDRYREFSRLLSPLGRTPRAVLLSERQAWRVHLDDGLVLELGRDRPRSPVSERLRGFVEAYPALAARLPFEPLAVDLRYSGGIALTAGANRAQAGAEQ